MDQARILRQEIGERKPVFSSESKNRKWLQKMSGAFLASHSLPAALDGTQQTQSHVHGILETRQARPCGDTITYSIFLSANGSVEKKSKAHPAAETARLTRARSSVASLLGQHKTWNLRALGIAVILMAS